MIIDFRKILAVPAIYNMFYFFIVGKSFCRKFLDEYIQPKENDKMLDIGCGTANILSYMHDIEYVGFDLSQLYITNAKKRYGKKGVFLCEKLSTEVIKNIGPAQFDIVLAIGLIHHLTDVEALELFECAKTALKPGGRFVTLDGCYVANQNKFARYIIDRDRGRYVRTVNEYQNLALKFFCNPKVTVTESLARIPYTYTILECTKEN